MNKTFQYATEAEKKTAIETNLQRVNAAINAACDSAQKPRDGMFLIAASKQQSAASVQTAFEAGQQHFGENYVQEGVAKIAALAALRNTPRPHANNKAALSPYPIQWHFIGPLQSNKSKVVAENFDWVHSVDSEKLAMRLSGQRPAHLPPLNVLVQVNIDDEMSKSGVLADQVGALCAAITVLPNIHLRGLMCIPKAGNTQALQAMKTLFEQLRVNFPQMDCLSMGMSADFEAAIAAGATHIRIGTAIFGARQY